MNEVKLEYNKFFQERMFLDNPVFDEEQKKILDEPIPIEALKKIEGSKLTSIESVYAYDLLNKVFGENGYILYQQVIEKDNGYVVVCLEFYAPKYNIYHIAYGGNQNQKEVYLSKGTSTKKSDYEHSLGWADSEKGALADALKNIMCRLSSGWRLVWKNQHEFTHEEEPISRFAIPTSPSIPVPPSIPINNIVPPTVIVNPTAQMPVALNPFVPPVVNIPNPPLMPPVQAVPVPLPVPNAALTPPMPTMPVKPPEPPKPAVKKAKPGELANAHQTEKINMPNIFNEIGGGETEFALQLRKNIENGTTSVFDQSVKYTFTEDQKRWLNALVDEIPF